MEFIILSVITAGGLGLIFGGGLAYAAKVFHVDKNPLIDEVLKLLPGANCGACGFAGCPGYAEAIVEQGMEINLCIPGGNTSSKAIAALLNREAVESTAQIAVLRCQGGCGTARTKGEYNGLQDCRAAVLIAGGNKFCDYGCIGLGSCVAVCPFDAITLSPEGLPVIDDHKCTGCGKCVAICPKQILELKSKIYKVYLGCSSRDKGKTVKDYCSKGCISCGLCVKKCPVQAIQMVNNLPVIDYQRCISCGICVSVCPTGSYRDRIKQRSKFFIDTKCTGCGQCVSV
ncbi:MAG: Fe-S cluster domain-containing protein, partial [Candidatus Delongbacteria bacterium]|nr:Fe-S cluster domain-containing protein [Candidatus Delongbacteria bacterium]